MTDSALITGHLFQNIPADLPDELVEILAQGSGVRIERIVSRGHCSPPGFWYEQAQQEWVLLLAGEAQVHFQVDDRRVHLTP